ncbi:MAG: photosynthetic reaction center subunit H [Acetobacteraceae bacterium]|nr:photosynthetic reaction center subunit H [Acetobacteraceae bacterium]
MRGALTSYIDVAQVTLYAFWFFFAGLVFYLRREDKREGYPLKSDRSAQVTVQGFPPLPRPKFFYLPHGGVAQAPRDEGFEEVKARRAENWLGAPLIPTGDPMVDGVGPAAWARRKDTPDVTFEGGKPRIVPLRVDPEFFLATEDPDPLGMTVYGCDRRPAGTVVDAWVDRSEVILRYLEVRLEGASAARTVLVPMNFLRIDRRRRRVNVRAITSAQFARVPGLRNPDEVTLLEEDRILAYYGGGTLFATAKRSEPLL